MTIEAFKLAPSPSSAENRTPSPQSPAAPRGTGVQDSPIIVGQKPQQIPVAGPVQPSQKDKLPWWEADWAKVARASQALKQKQEVIRMDTLTAPAAVEGQDYSDVINLDFTSYGVQGVRHLIQLSDRPGSPLIPRYVEASHDGFPRPPIDVAIRTPYVPRNVDDGTQVPPGFVDQLGPPKQLRENALPYYQ